MDGKNKGVLQCLKRIRDWAEEDQPRKDDYSSVFEKPKAAEGARENPLEVLKFGDVTDFFFAVTEQYTDVQKSVLELMEPETVGGRPLYCVKQTFTNKQRETITIKNSTKILGRIVYTRSLDRRLADSFERQNPFEL